MLNSICFRSFCFFLKFGIALKYFPYQWDAKNKRLQKGNARTWFVFSIHRIILVTMLCFSSFRLMQAFSRPNFPLLLKVLNIAWVGGYSLSMIGFSQWESAEKEVRQFGNWILEYSDPDRKSVSRYRTTKTDDERKEARRLSFHLMFGLILFLGNPGVHTTLVNETPCAPHFTSSLAFPCVGYSGHGVPFLHKLPFIVVEYYMIMTMFVSITYNWAMLYLGVSWMLKEVNSLRWDLILRKVHPPVEKYRSIEVTANMINDAFSRYLAAFPSFLFFMVSTLLFGVIRLLHVAPLANLMFPLCSVECLFDAVTPLAVSGDLNAKDKDLGRKWKRELAINKPTPLRKLQMAYQKSYNCVRCTSGHFFTFENTIVLVCLHNCIQLTLNMLVSFKRAAY